MHVISYQEGTISHLVNVELNLISNLQQKQGGLEILNSLKLDVDHELARADFPEFHGVHLAPQRSLFQVGETILNGIDEFGNNRGNHKNA